MRGLLLVGFMTWTMILNTPQVEAADYYVGVVTKVSDGDTAVVQAGGNKFSVRFAGIDAPEVRHNNNETDQPWGQQSKSALERKILNQRVNLDCNGQSYDRKVCTVYLGSENVNAWLVQHGHAWAYDKYDRSGAMQKLEDQARSKRIGIWSLPERQQMNPEAWRRSR